MPKLKSEKHHWWPRCVSIHWTADDGKVGRITPDGKVTRSTPEQFGMIRNGHHIKLHRDAGEWTVWDSSFEREFDRADGNFPRVVEWLGTLEHNSAQACHNGRFVEQAATDEQLVALTESVVSLVVRSPRNREASVSLAEHLRGKLHGQERNALIGSNMRRSQRLIADSIGHRAKFAVLYSREKEFIYGDGFFHNLSATVNPPNSPKMLVPLTPSMAVVIVRPLSYRTQPRFVSAVLEPAEVDLCNHAVQVYSQSEIFFRLDRPVLDAAFLMGKHVEYAHPDNPIDSFIRSIPGVPDRNRSLPL